MQCARAAVQTLTLGLFFVAAVACAGPSSSDLAVRVTPRASPEAPADAGEGEHSRAPQPVATVQRPRLVSLADLTTDVVVPELPAVFAAPAHDPALEEAVRAALAGHEGTYSVVVHNLLDGRYAAVNEGQVYYAASLFKMGLLLEVYRQRDAQEVDFAQTLTLDEKYASYDLGTLEYLGLHQGDSLTLADAVKAMIVVSDTPTAVMVQDTVKPARVDATLRSLGIEETSFNDYDLPATARDMARLLQAIAVGDGVSEESRREMLSLLLQETIRHGIPAALAPDAAVAHKTGNWTESTHDVALVWGPAGPYIIAVMSDRAWEWQPVVDVSLAVWDYFAANP